MLSYSRVPNIPYNRTFSKSKLEVLKAIDELGGKCINPQLREALGISPQILSCLISELEKKALITVENNTADRRIKKVQMTNAG